MGPKAPGPPTGGAHDLKPDGAGPGAEPNPSRPLEIEEWWNARLIHPASRAIARLLEPTFVTPNAVSVTGAAAIAAAGFAYSLIAWPASALVGFLLHGAWNVLDGTDGELARRTGKTSTYGEIVDGLCDYGGHIVLYVTLAAFLSGTLGLWAWGLATAAGGSRILQANHYETLRHTYVWRYFGAPWLRRTASNEGIAVGRSLPARTAAGLAGAYVALSSSFSRDAMAVDERFAALADDPAALARARGLGRDAERIAVQRAGCLSADLRTLALGVSMAAADSPLWFFLLECTLLNGVLAWSVIGQGRRNRRLAAELSAW